MNVLVPGGIAQLNGTSRSSVVVDVDWAPGGVHAEVYAFVCDAQRRLLSKGHLVFARPERGPSPDRAVFVRSQGAGGVTNRGQVQVDLSSLTANADHVLCVLAVSTENAILEPVADIRVAVWDPVTGEPDARLEVGGGGVNKCMLLGLVRRSGDGWSFEALAQGFESSIVQLANRHA